MGSFNYLFYYSHKVEFVHGYRILPDFMTNVAKPIYAVLNTYNLDMIHQHKNMHIVMNPARIASGDWKS